MSAETCPLQVLLITVAGWVNRHQQDVIAYLVEENRVLKEQFGGKVPRLDDGQRRHLAAKGKVRGHAGMRTGDQEPQTRLTATTWSIARWEGFDPDGEVYAK